MDMACTYQTPQVATDYLENSQEEIYQIKVKEEWIKQFFICKNKMKVGVM